MDIKELCNIAEHASIRVVFSYSGEGKFALGISDGVTTPIVANGTPEEIEITISQELPKYKEKILLEAEEKRKKEEETKQKALIQATQAEIKRKELASKITKPTVQNNEQEQLSLF